MHLQISADAAKSPEGASRRFTHFSASLFYGEHTIWSVSRKVIAAGYHAPEPCDALPLQWDILLGVFFINAGHSGSADTFVFDSELFNHELCVPLVGFDFPSGIRAPNETVENVAFLLLILSNAQLLGVNLVGFRQLCLELCH